MSDLQIQKSKILSNHQVIKTATSTDSGLKDSGIKPLPLAKTMIFWLLPAVSLYSIHYFLVPAYVELTGVPYFKGYLVGYVFSMTFFFVAALAAYRVEGNSWTSNALKSRFRLMKMKRGDWLWIIGIILLVFVTYFGLAFTGDWTRSVSFLAPREIWPTEFGPGGTNNLTPGVFMDMPMKGEWLLVLLYIIGWFFNIFGEEFWFRGYILPRQELAFGSFAWLANGLMFTFNHLWQPWILIAILPSSLLLAYVVQKRRNTWIGIIQHGLVNLSLVIVLLAGAIGIFQ
jgi:membrane protease YdiL (CAAX protease family)